MSSLSKLTQNIVLRFRQRREQAREEAKRKKAEEERIKQAAAAKAAAEAEAVRKAEAAAQQVVHRSHVVLCMTTSQPETCRKAAFMCAV